VLAAGSAVLGAGFVAGVVGAAEPGALAAGSATGAQMAGTINLSMLIADRMLPPMLNQISMATPNQITAEEKKTLGTGKKERNTSVSGG
jgi:hypothetical protein